MRLLEKYPKQALLLGVGAFIIFTGMAFLWPIVTIYIHEHLGKSLSVAGGVLFINQLTLMVGNLVGGFLYDRIGGKKTLLYPVLCSSIVLTFMSVYQDFNLFVILFGLNGLFIGMVFPALNSLIVHIWPEGGRKALNLIYVFQNVGVAVGAFLGGILVQFSYTYAFFGNALLLFLFVVVYVFLLPDIRMRPDTQKQNSEVNVEIEKVGSRNHKWTTTWVPLILLSLGLMITWVFYVQWTTTIPTYIKGLDISLTSYSMLWTINGLVIVLGQPLLSWSIQRLRLDLYGQLGLGSVIFVISAVFVYASESYYGFVAAMVVMTIGEMLIWPAIPAIAAELASTGQTGLFQGIVSGAGAAGRMLGPIIGALLYDTYSAKIMFLIMILITIVAVLIFALYKPYQKYMSQKRIQNINAHV